MNKKYTQNNTKVTPENLKNTQNDHKQVEMAKNRHKMILKAR